MRDGRLDMVLGLVGQCTVYCHVHSFEAQTQELSTLACTQHWLWVGDALDDCPLPNSITAQDGFPAAASTIPSTLCPRGLRMAVAREAQEPGRPLTQPRPYRVAPIHPCAPPFMRPSQGHPTIHSRPAASTGRAQPYRDDATSQQTKSNKRTVVWFDKCWVADPTD